MASQEIGWRSAWAEAGVLERRELVKAGRYKQRRNGEPVYQNIGIDADVAAIIAYLRTFKPAGTQLPPIRKGTGFQEDIARGFGNARQQIARYQANPPEDMGAKHEWGRYLVMTTCTGCHNGKLQGYEGFTPDLDVAGTYSATELNRLLTTGEGKTKKDLGMMSDMARNHFSKMTPREREAVVGYVLARAHRPQQPQ